MEYSSVIRIQSQLMPEVHFVIRKISFGRRAELLKRIAHLLQQYEFHTSSDDPKEKAKAEVLAAEIEKLYLECGLVRVENLWIDGEEATVETLFERGPEELCREILAHIKAQFGLNDEERKNS